MPLVEALKAKSIRGGRSTPMGAKSLLQGSGEMADLIRSKDWSVTALGAIETWSETFLATVNILLLSPFSFAIYWGPELTLFYNDAYRPFLGGKHPQALGATGPMVWSEAWDTLGPPIQAALDEGEAMTAREAYIPILTDGKLQDRWWTYSFYPLYEGGGIAGVANPGSEDTAAVLARKATLRERVQVLEVFQQAPVFFALLQGPDHVFAMQNTLYQRLINHRDVLNKPVRAALPEVVGQGFIEILDRVYQGEPFVGNGFLLQVSRGEGLPLDNRYVDFVYQPLREPDGSVSGIIVVGVDATDRREAQDAALKLAAIVDSSEDVILSKDLNGIVTSWNPAASRLFGYSAAEMVGSSILKLIPENLHSDEKTILESIRAGRRLEHFETVRVAKDGRLIDVSLTISPIRDNKGRVTGASKILRDVSDRKRAERSLIQAEKIAATGRMAATIAHEVNNPLEAMMNLLYLLRSSVTDEAGLSYLSTAEGELERVSHIAKQTLGYYREHAAASAASLAELAEHAISIYEPRCTAANIEISRSFQSSRKPVLRRGEMMQVISNILANSIHAMPSGGHLSISVEDADVPISGITLTVSDTGVGIAPNDLPRVFDAFFTIRSTVGTGIGLFVTKQFVEGHGGRLSITSKKDATNHGTTIRILLPLQTLYDVPQNAALNAGPH